MKSILVPFDMSEPSQHALEYATKLLKGVPDARITVLFVTPLPEFDNPTFEAASQMAGVAPISGEKQAELQEKYLENQKKKLVSKVESLNVQTDAKIVYRVASGRPQDIISEYADSNEYDLITMGSRGLGAIRGALGSVSYAVLRLVDIPVLVVK